MAQQYRRYAPNPDYNPLYAVDNAGKAADAARKEIKQMQDFYQSRRLVDQQTIEDTRFVGQNLEALASFTKTGAEFLKEQAKRDKEAIEIGETWDAYTKGIDQYTVMTETRAEATAETQDEIVAATRENLDPVAALKLENARKMGRGFKGEKAALTHGRNSYGSYMINFLSGDNYVMYKGEYLPAGQLLAEGGIDYADKLDAVMQAARFEFIKTNKFHLATKKNFVEILGPTMDAVEQNLRTNKTTMAAAQYQKDQAAKIDAEFVDSMTFLKGARTREDYQQVVNVAFNLYRTNNTGLTSRQINERIVRKATAAIMRSDNPDNLAIFKTVEQRPGEPKTALGKQYAEVFLEAEIEAQNLDNQYDTLQADRIAEKYAQKRAQPGLTQADRLKLIQDEKAEYEGLKSKVGYDRIQRLNGNTATYVLDPNVAVNDQKLRMQIQSGDFLPPEIVHQGMQNGLYSPKAYEEYKEAYSQKDKANLPSVKKTYEGMQDSIDDLVDRTLGLKKDASGTYKLTTQPLTYVDYSTSTNLTTAINRDLIIERDRLLRNSEEVDPIKLSAIVADGLSKWFQTNFYERTGKYYLNGFWSAERSQRTNADYGKKNFKPAFDKFKKSATMVSPSSLPKELSSTFDMNMSLPVEVAADYSPTRGDTLFNDEQLENMRVAWDNGNIDPGLVNASEGVNMSPLDLMNYELAAHRQAPYTPQIDTASISGAKQGAHAFELAGFPSRSAGFMAAAISYTTDWSDPESLQLEQWAEQMRLENPRAYRLLMAPGSSPRHMQQAMNDLAGMELPNLSALAQYLTA